MMQYTHWKVAMKEVWHKHKRTDISFDVY